MRKVIPIAVLIVLVLVPSLPKTKAPPVGVVWTSTLGGVPKVVFDWGEWVRINWIAGEPVDIVVIYVPSNTKVIDLSNQPATGYVDFKPDKAGYYYIILSGYQIPNLFAYGMFFVIPALPIGTILGAISCLGAFGLVKLKKRKYS